MTNATAPTRLPKANDSCWCGSGKKFKRCHKEDEFATVVRDAATGRPKPTVHKGKVSAIRSVPAHIARPDYVDNGGRPKVTKVPLVKSADTIERMRISCAAAARVLALVGQHVRPGVTTEELDIVAHDAYIAEGGYPSCVTYGKFPKSICTSVNEVICHGIPDDRALVEGDIVNVDVTIFLNGVHGDTNATFFVGEVDQATRRLVEHTERSMWAGIDAVRPGRPISDIGAAIEGYAKRHGYGIVTHFVGHGIGEIFHMPPNVPHYYERSATLEMKPGMTFTIEPMVTIGRLHRLRPVVRRMDRRHVEPRPHRAVRAHHPRHRGRPGCAHPPALRLVR